MSYLKHNGQMVLSGGSYISGIVPNVMEYWNDDTFTTFTTSGIDITSAIGDGGVYNQFCRSNHFNVIGGLPSGEHTFGIINVKFDIVINSGVNLYTYFTNYTQNSTGGNSLNGSGPKEYNQYVTYTGVNEFSFGFEVKTGGNGNFSVSNLFITVTDW